MESAIASTPNLAPSRRMVSSSRPCSSMKANCLADDRAPGRGAGRGGRSGRPGPRDPRRIGCSATVLVGHCFLERVTP